MCFLFLKEFVMTCQIECMYPRSSSASCPDFFWHFRLSAPIIWGLLYGSSKYHRFRQYQEQRYWEVRLHMSTNYNPVVKVEGRRPDTLTTGLFLLSIPGMATWQTYNPSLIKFEPLVDPGNPKTCLSITNSRNSRPLAKTVHCINYRYCMTPTIRGA